jgi:hypothetical protein
MSAEVIAKKAVRIHAGLRIFYAVAGKLSSPQITPATTEAV